MYVPQEQRTLMKNAMEMAVMQSLSHPNGVLHVILLFYMLFSMFCTLGVMPVM